MALVTLPWLLIATEIFPFIVTEIQPTQLLGSGPIVFVGLA